MNNPFLYIDANGNTKSFDFSPWGGIEGFLDMTAQGGTVGANGVLGARLMNCVPDLFRAIDMTATAVSSLPFDLVDKNGDIVDSSVDWQNTIGGLPNPQRILYQIAASLCGGSAYIFPRLLSNRLIDLTYYAPQTITPKANPDRTGYFIRNINGKTENINIEDLLYFWLPDRNVEFGPAEAHPMGNAVLAASIKLGMNAAIKESSERGFIPPTVLAAKNMPPGDEKKKAETWWNRFLRGGFRGEPAKIVNAESVDIKEIGAGMDKLKGSYIEITREASEDIGKAFGIPAALFMSDNAYASEFKQIRKQWKSESVFVTIYKTIEETLTDQLLKRFGFYMFFRPETLDEFKDDEAAQSTTLLNFVSAFEKDPEVARVGMSILGYDTTDEQDKTLDAIVSERKKKQEEEPKEPTNQPQEQMNDESMPVRALTPDEMKDLTLWYSKSKAWFAKGKGAAADWENKHLSEEIAAPIRVKLANARTERDIVEAFRLQQKQVNPVMYLADVLNRALNETFEG